MGVHVSGMRQFSRETPHKSFWVCCYALQTILKQCQLFHGACMIQKLCILKLGWPLKMSVLGKGQGKDC